MRKVIEDKLIKLGISPSLRGFDAICETVEILMKSKERVKIVALYGIVGMRHGDSAQTIERTIRYAISKMNKDVYKEMGGIGKTNGEILTMLAFWCRREVEDDE